jgi:hypothetical protein
LATFSGPTLCGFPQLLPFELGFELGTELLMAPMGNPAKVEQ